MRDVFDIWVGQVSKKLLSLTITTTLVFRRFWWGSLFLLLAVNTITSLVSLRGILIQIASFASLLGIWLTEFHQVMGHLSSQSKLEGIGILEECFSWKNCRQAVRAGTGRCMVSIH